MKLTQILVFLCLTAIFLSISCQLEVSPNEVTPVESFVEKPKAAGVLKLLNGKGLKCLKKHLKKKLGKNRGRKLLRVGAKTKKQSKILRKVIRKCKNKKLFLSESSGVREDNCERYKHKLDEALRVGNLLKARMYRILIRRKCNA